jgi:acetyl-CoA carboxylase/biotin carboxylase 1
MEMYADIDVRAGVLEPEGIVEIKVRRDKILKLMERLNSVFASLKKESVDQSKTAEERAAAVEKLAVREKHLEPSYKQAALLYADLYECVFFFCFFFFLDILMISLSAGHL